MSVQLPEDKIIKIGGDKGYISSKRFKLNNGKRIKLIAKKRNNQAVQNTEREKKVLKKRLSVEKALASIKIGNFNFRIIGYLLEKIKTLKIIWDFYLWV